ncbi:MAG: leucine-rich repeat domain-containing protein [Clostridiales bacterium]|nr:leucine-rich repeat domain-containing protein [Clostridiales bacterium]
MATAQESQAAQWAALVDRYIAEGSFADAERLVRRMLEFGAGDERTDRLYRSLQNWKYLDVRNGVLVRYTGRASALTLPECIHVIEDGAFQDNRRLTAITLPASVRMIEDGAFSGCINLKMVNTQGGVETVGKAAFENTPYDPMRTGRCLHCGGEISVFGKCKNCGRLRAK